MQRNYTLKPTVGQTLKANSSLEKVERDKKYLYDFSILYEADIEDEKKQEIKDQIIKYTNVTFRNSAVFNQTDSRFDRYSGEYYIKAYPCYATDGKRKYVIMRLVKLDVVFYERKCIYDDFDTVSEIHECCDTDYTIEHLNIA